VGIKKEVIIGDCRLLLGDCLSIMPLLGKVDAVVTDPPYGVGIDYTYFSDDVASIQRVAIAAVTECISLFQRVVITPGNKTCWLYPQPTHQGVFFYPSGAGTCKWGFTCSQPIFYYGDDPYLKAGKGSRPDSFRSTEHAEKNGHPCPKPIGQMLWLVKRASLVHETILDPFMGSGTTGVACAKMGRKFIGIELDEDYFNIACKRIEEAYASPDMFVEAQKKPEQESLL